MQPTLSNISLVKQGSAVRLMAIWHCAFRAGGSVGEEK